MERAEKDASESPSGAGEDDDEEDDEDEDEADKEEQKKAAGKMCVSSRSSHSRSASSACPVRVGTACCRGGRADVFLRAQRRHLQQVEQARQGADELEGR